MPASVLGQVHNYFSSLSKRLYVVGVTVTSSFTSLRGFLVSEFVI